MISFRRVPLLKMSTQFFDALSCMMMLRISSLFVKEDPALEKGPLVVRLVNFTGSFFNQDFSATELEHSPRQFRCSMGLVEIMYVDDLESTQVPFITSCYN